jgi:hypothetical protein
MGIFHDVDKTYLIERADAQRGAIGGSLTDNTQRGNIEQSNTNICMS